jgi:hypothetical protein
MSTPVTSAIATVTLRWRRGRGRIGAAMSPGASVAVAT